MGVNMFDRKQYMKNYDRQKYLKNPEKVKERSKQWIKDNPEKRKKITKYWREHNPEYNKQWRKDNPEKAKQYRQDNKEHLRKAHIKYKYNLSYENWLKMWESQNGECAICGESFNAPSESCVDHNHKTDKVRGLLCNKCNVAIGLLNDNPILTAKVTEYLLRNDING